ncbi:hypothetical protein HRbin02_00570 [Candidatus Calditenuaceae archaeon HR02]|nr:hypothetical protein HRbin02_00570 [Candidatus Calditenuaceae archaeon HR02]
MRILKDYSTDILKVRLDGLRLRYYPAAGSGAYDRGFKYSSKCQQYINTDAPNATQNKETSQEDNGLRIINLVVAAVKLL